MSEAFAILRHVPSVLPVQESVMNSRIPKALGVLAVAGISLGLLACDDDPDPEEARVAVCNDYTEYQNAVADYDALGDSQTLTEYEAAANRVADAASDLEDSATDYLDANDPLVEELVTALDNLDNALGDLTESMTAGEAKAAVKDEYDAAVAARDKIVDNANCT